MKRSFFQAVVVLVLLYACTTWTLTKRPEKKLDGNYTRMLRAILNKSWRQHPTKHQLYGHLPPITTTIQIRRSRYAGHCWRNRDELISDILLWTPTYGRAKARRPARTYIQQLCEDTGCSPEDPPETMNDREKWQERVRDINAGGTTWWWWWWWWSLQVFYTSITWSWVTKSFLKCLLNILADRRSSKIRMVFQPHSPSSFSRPLGYVVTAPKNFVCINSIISSSSSSISIGPEKMYSLIRNNQRSLNINMIFLMLFLRWDRP